MGTLLGTLLGMKKRKDVLPPRIRRHSSGGYRGVAVVAGRRAYGPTFDRVEDAVAWLDTIDRLQRQPHLVDEPLTLRTAWDLLAGDLADGAAADGTVAFYKRAHHELLAVLGDVRLDRLTEPAIRLYIDRRKRRGVSPHTIVRKELGTLRRIVRLAMSCGRLGRDPLAGIRMPRVRGGRYKTIDAATVEAAIRRIREANADHADIVELIWRTSLRRAEAARLRPEDVDLQARRLWVRGKAVDRYRPIAEALVPVLERMVDRAAGGPLISSARKIEKVFESWRARLRLHAFSPHVLRHGFASELLNRGVPPPVVASLMGHTGLRMLERYYHAQDAALRAALDALSPATPRPPRP